MKKNKMESLLFYYSAERDAVFKRKRILGKRCTKKATWKHQKDKPVHLQVHWQVVEDQIFPTGNVQCQSKQSLHLSEQANISLPGKA